MGFSRQEYWSGSPFPSPGDLLDPEIEFVSPALQEDSLPLNHQGSPIYDDYYSYTVSVLALSMLPLVFHYLMS